MRISISWSRIFFRLWRQPQSDHTHTDPYFATEDVRNITNNVNDMEDTILQPLLATTHGLDLLVCPPLPRAVEAEMRLHQAQMV